MDKHAEQREHKRRRQARRALKMSRRYMADPKARLPRLLAAYAELRAQRANCWVLPDA
ncbi:MAG: hypothetical protein AAF618_02520 [Pseudomonadota bacterium]